MTSKSLVFPFGFVALIVPLSAYFLSVLGHSPVSFTAFLSGTSIVFVYYVYRIYNKKYQISNFALRFYRFFSTAVRLCML